MPKRKVAAKRTRINYRKMWRDAVQENERIRCDLKVLQDQWAGLLEATENEMRGQGQHAYMSALARLIQNTLGDGLTVLSGVRRLCLERKMKDFPVDSIKRSLMSTDVLSKVVDGVLDASCSEMELEARAAKRLYPGYV